MRDRDEGRSHYRSACRRPRTDRVRVPGLWTSHERIGPAEPALRRLNCCALPVKTHQVPATLLGVERWSPARALSRPGPFLRRPPEGCRPDAQQSAPLISLRPMTARSAHLRRLAECGARVSAAADAVTKARFEQGGAGMACACTRAEQVEREQHGPSTALERRFEWRFARGEEAHSRAI